MQIQGPSNPAANKGKKSKIWTNGDTIIWLFITSNFSFSHNVFKNSLLLMHQNEYLWSEGLKQYHPFFQYCVVQEILNKVRSKM